MQKTTVELIDDLDGEPASRTALLGFDGKWYEIDLSDENYQALQGELDPFVAVARKVPGAPSPRRRNGLAASGPGRSGQSESRVIREWAKRNGHDVADRGRIPADIAALYHARPPSQAASGM